MKERMEAPINTRRVPLIKYLSRKREEEEEDRLPAGPSVRPLVGRFLSSRSRRSTQPNLALVAVETTLGRCGVTSCEKTHGGAKYLIE